VIWVADRGFTSEANRRHLTTGGGGYILGEKLRSGSPEAKTALARQGRYQDVRENLRVKEVNLSKVSDQLGTNERFIGCHNPDAAERDAAIRQRILERVQAMIENTDRLSATKRAELRGVISTKPGLNRYLRVTPAGCSGWTPPLSRPRPNWTGKYLLRTSDPHLSTQDVALGYKRLLEVERGWARHETDPRPAPVYHRLEDRIRAHVTLCWLALLLARIIETRTGTTWPAARAQLQRLHLGTFTGRPAASARPPPSPPRLAACTTPSASRSHPRSCTWTPNPAPGTAPAPDQARSPA
jgi:transposase